MSHDAERLARFEREAKVLASLNHPNIAQIYAVAEGAPVMELVPGKTPAGAVPLETALSYARQIALALEAAHEKAIIHRDLKPGNIMITPEGVVKVLDFGLGLAYQSETARDPENSTTLTLANTQVGVVMGTPAYMSPEQAAGKRVDRRSDIWSFGVVLDERLTGKRLFHGETASHTLASVLKEPIDFGRLPKITPPAIRVLLERCLDRDPKTRLRDIGEARIAIDRNSLPLPEGARKAENAKDLAMGRRCRVRWRRLLCRISDRLDASYSRAAKPRHFERCDTVRRHSSSHATRDLARRAVGVVRDLGFPNVRAQD